MAGGTGWHRRGKARGENAGATGDIPLDPPSEGDGIGGLFACGAGGREPAQRELRPTEGASPCGDGAAEDIPLDPPSKGEGIGGLFASGAGGREPAQRELRPTWGLRRIGGASPWRGLSVCCAGWYDAAAVGRCVFSGLEPELTVKTITVQVREDHLETLARTKPMAALAELVWNALDAEAREVRVEFVENALEGLETIRIVDDGTGLHYDDAFIVFQNLGGSWKRQGQRTHAQKRVLHGKFGKGRFRAFSLGNRVEWRSVFQDGADTFTYSILGKAVTPGEFSISDAKRVPETGTGMTVEISYPPISVGLLRGVKARQEVTDIFALYLRQYPNLKIVYDGVPIDPANAESHFAEIPLEPMIMENGERVEAVLTVVEWNLPGKRGVYLCDEDGFMRQAALPRLHFRGFSYTAYLKSAHVAALDKEGLLSAGELSADVRQLLQAARQKLREHFTLREASFARGTIEEWKELGLYPYAAEPANDLELTERRIFDIYATHLNQIYPDFATSSPRNRRLLLRLLQELVRSEPTRVARLLDELVSFPEEKEEEILELVQG